MCILEETEFIFLNYSGLFFSPVFMNMHFVWKLSVAFLFFPFPWLEGGMSVQIFLKCIFSDMKFQVAFQFWIVAILRLCDVCRAKKWKQASIVLFTFSEFRFTPYLYTGSRSASPCYYYLLCQVALYFFQWSGLSDGLDTKGKTLPKNTKQVNLVGKNLLKLILTSSYVVLVWQLFVFC